MEKILKKPELIFVIIAFCFGMLFLTLTPPMQVADENSHFLRACEITDGRLYNNPKLSQITQPPTDKLIKRLVTRSEYTRQAEGYSPLLYTFSTIGVSIGKIFKNSYLMFYLARFFNLIAWIIITSLAIRITPIFKWLFFFTALLPMTVFEGMSIAADSFNNAFAFLFFAYIFKLIYTNKELNRKEFITLTVMSLISSLTKGSIFPIILFFFLPIKKHRVMFTICNLLIAFGITLYWSSINNVYIRPELDPMYHKQLLLANPLDFVKLSISTIMHNTKFYIQGCIGILGWLTIYLNKFVYQISSILFFVTFFFTNGEKVTFKQRCTALITFLTFVLAVFLMYYIIWTYPTEHKIMGIQGRYFIPILPLTFLIFAQSKPHFSIKCQNYYKYFLILYCVLLLTYTTYVLYQNYY